MFKKSCSTLKFHSRRFFSLQKLDVLDWKKQEQILLEPLQYINQLPNKQHKIVAPAFNHWLQVPKEKFEVIEDAMRTLVSWFILIDDIQDDSALRYGVPSAHVVFGKGLTINATSHAIFVMEKKLMELENPLAQKVFVNKMIDLLNGQGSDIYWGHNYIYPSEEDHIEMAKKKNGTFFALPVELMQLFSSNGINYSDLATNIGVYYSLVDDYYNLFQPKALKKLSGANKVPADYITCSDITEGKITLPIIHAMQFPDVANELADILKQRTSDQKLLDRSTVLLKKHGSDEYMRDVLRRLEAEIRTEIDHKGGNALLTTLVDELGFKE